MATSGSKNYSITAIEVIGGALRKLGAFDHGEAIPAEEVQDAMQALNLLVKEWSAQGIDIWLRDEMTVFLDTNTANTAPFDAFELPSEPAGTNWPDLDEIDKSAGLLAVIGPYTETTNVFNIVWGNGSYVIPLGVEPLWTQNTVISNTTASENYENEPGSVLGLQKDDGRWFICRPERAIDGGSGISITTIGVQGQFPDGPTATAGNRLVIAKNMLEIRPEDILYGMRRSTDGQDVPLNLIGEVEYQRLSRKDQQGPTTNIWYQKRKDIGELHFWPSGRGSNFDRLIFQARFLPDDIDAVSNEAEFPIEWANALIFNLAHDLAPEYGVDQKKRIEMYTIGQKKLNDLLDVDQENANVVFTISQRV